MCLAGSGQHQMSNFLAALEIPLLPPKSLKAREREIAPVFSQVPQESCSKALEEDITLSQENKGYACG